MSTVSRLFNSPADDVWSVIADGWLYSGWVVGASRIRAVDAHWPEAGSLLHHSVGAWPLVISDSTRVTAVEPGRSLEVVARGWSPGVLRDPLIDVRNGETLKRLELMAAGGAGS